MSLLLQWISLTIFGSIFVAVLLLLPNSFSYWKYGWSVKFGNPTENQRNKFKTAKRNQFKIVAYIILAMALVVLLQEIRFDL